MAGLLHRDQFKVVAHGGLGRETASTAHSMAFFRGALYLGTSTGSVTGVGEAPRILRYRPKEGDWETVYEPPLLEPNTRTQSVDRQVASNMKSGFGQALAGRKSSDQAPRDIGYRSMTVFKGKSDKQPVLYVGAMSRWGGLILRSADGETFEPVTEPGMGNPDVYSFRGLASLGDKLFTSPSGTITDEYLDRNMAPEAKIYVSEDPARGVWREAAEPGFGDPANVAIYTASKAHDRLYAGTQNAESGFQVWRTAATGRPPYKWERVITDGAGAYNHNLAATAMAEFGGALYVGSGITGFGYDRIHDIGPASAELLRIWPDGSWDLISGQPRFTPEGLKVPLSLLGPGLGDFYNSVVWELRAHDGALYLGTHQWEAFRSVELNAENIVGGYQLWGSADGENWEVIIEDGRGNPADIGVRTLCSTPLGLFVGSHTQSRLLQIMAMRKRPGLKMDSGFEVLLGASADQA